jgi:hypothetical protein
MTKAPQPAELDLGTKRRGRPSSFASSISQELLLGVAGGLPRAFAELVEQLLSEREEAAALSTRLRSTRVPQPPPEPEFRLDPRRAAAATSAPR